MRKLIFTVLLIGCLLLTGCAGLSKEPPLTDPAQTTQPPTTTQTTPATVPAPTTQTTLPTEPAGDTSLEDLRQEMAATPEIFAVAYFGKAAVDTDIPAFMQEAAPGLCENRPFLLSISAENIIGTYGYLFCIVPADETATVAVNFRWWDGEAYDEPEVLYRSEAGDPILVLCPNDNAMPNTEVIITDSEGNVAVYYPHMDNDYRVAPLCDEAGDSLILDFTDYKELPNPLPAQSDLVGTWQLAWTEVEGDRNEADPGACIIEITADKEDSIWVTYKDRDFPDWNFSDRELLVVLGEMYPGCGNEHWIAEVGMQSGDTNAYAFTLLEDGTLLLQTYWEMDGMPMVSYGWYERID